MTQIRKWSWLLHILFDSCPRFALLWMVGWSRNPPLPWFFNPSHSWDVKAINWWISQQKSLGFSWYFNSCSWFFIGFSWFSWVFLGFSWFFMVFAWVFSWFFMVFSWFFMVFSWFFTVFPWVFRHQTDPSLSSDSHLFDLIRPHDVAGVAK